MLKVHTRNLGTVTVLSLQGRVVNGETAILRNVLNTQSDVSTLVLDFARVNAVDASGLGLMLELREQAEARGIGFKLINVTRLVRRVLEVTRLDSVFEVASGVEYLPAVSRGRAASLMPLARCA